MNLLSILRYFFWIKSVVIKSQDPKLSDEINLKEDVKEHKFKHLKLM
jgi:hypothetical protein